MADGLSKKEIRQALESILATRPFTKSPLLSKFLRFVVETTLNGQSNQIKEYTVGINVLGKPKSFNPKLDASVRINANRLRKILAEYYELEGNEQEIRIELPKGSYYPHFLYQTSDSNIHKEQPDPSPTDRDDTICILPFTGFIQHPTLDFSLSGFCEFLSEKLSLFQDIKVVSFHSASRFTEEGGNLANIGKALGVSYYLTGSIELDQDQFQVSFQLIEAESNTFIWSRQMHASLLSTEVMEAADHISNQIVSSLAGYSGIIHYRKVLNINQEPHLSNKSANAIFWFYHYQVNHTKALFYEAIQKLEKVVAEDENCALCWAVLAQLYGDALIYNYPTEKSPLETAYACATKALEQDEYCQHAHLSMGWIHILTRNKKELLTRIKKVDSINPNSSLFKAMCSLGLSLAGEYEDSLVYLKKAKLLHPLPYWWMSLPEILVAINNNEYEKVVFLARKASTPRVIFEYVFEMIGLYYKGDIETLKKVVQVYKDKYPDGIAFLQNALPAILLDDEPAGKIRFALQEIDKIKIAISAN
jgi:TolB-like protein